ncbi:riboflavin synthase subunit alpha [Salinibius halmophilus]|uniref:riboflavin synthase subunit alpha n=1 Tax=Salinibius halmophilus TaxID=1853216 RepID=UPI000E66F39D|nr:riboflavin synthase subunit alpha [Salinibius halmophilus]
MFTGIVKGLAKVEQIEQVESLKRLTIALPSIAQGNIELGASIAINGCCLTVVEQIDDSRVCFDVIAESLSLTNLGQLEVGDSVNVERSFTVGAEIGGHIISGHIATTCEVLAIENQAQKVCWRLSLPEQVKEYVLPKGFIGLDGCSLTVGEVREDSFDIHLIPETLSRTVFGFKKVGDRINLEVDAQTQAIVDTVKRYMSNQKG